MRLYYRVGAEDFEVVIEKLKEGYRVAVGDEEHEVLVKSVSDGEMVLIINGSAQRAVWVEEKGLRWVGINGRSYVLEKVSTGMRAGSGGADGGNLVCAPMPGQVREVMVTEGEQVERGQTLLLLEAMKMEMRIFAPQDGKVTKLKIQAGRQVDKDDVLLEVE